MVKLSTKPNYMTPEQRDKLKDDIHRVVSVLPVKVLALGYLRYEKLRLLNASQYAELNRKTLTRQGHFDDLVDQLEEPK
jgi:hypothetical protein